jgi:hypothetical protein
MLMLRSTFIHIPGVGESMERSLWEQDILTWDDFLKKNHTCCLHPLKKERMMRIISQSINELESKNHSFFSGLLPKNQHWRAYKHFDAGFLDIETTGLSKERNDVTVIGLYDGECSKIFVNGHNLHLFEQEIKKYSMLVTFNGSCFDLPFLAAKFPDADFSHLHVDLRFVMRKLGFFGGLKSIEKQLGIARDDDIAEVNGLEAVRLWKRYLRGDPDALRTLIEYNQADIENLKIIMDYAYRKLSSEFLQNANKK